MLEVQKVSKSYQSYQALSEVSFSVKPGEIVGFLGVNGAGKTSTMRIITGFLFPSAGDVLINGHSVVSDTLMAQRELGYLPENNPLYLEMPVWRFLEWIRQIKSAALENVTEIVEKLELRDVLEKKIGHLSKGYRQRVGLAQAMLGSPSLLVLDEPTSGLDPVQKEQILAFIKSFSSQKHAVLFSSHILSEVSEIADRIVVIDKGEIKMQGAPESLTSKAHNDNEVTITVRTKATLAAVDKALTRLNPKPQLKAEQQGSVHQIKVIMSKKTNQTNDAVVEQLSRALVSGKIAILGLEVQKSDIKDIFTMLSNGQKRK